MTLKATGAIALAAFAVAAGFATRAAAQDDYPNRVVRLVVPTAAGGSTDIIGRVVAAGLSERLGRQVVVDNRPGAGTIIGGEIVARSKPDGYTLLMGASALALNPSIYKKMPYDALRDFAPITLAVIIPNVIIVHPSVPATSVKEMIALAKARPGEILYASGGIGTNPHLSMELFASMAQIRMVHVPYKAGAPAMTAVLSGEAALMAQGMASAVPHVRAGRLRALGVTSAKRVSAAPEIRTIAESGLPGYESVQWPGVLAPAGTSRDIVAKLHKETVAVLRAPETRSRLAGDGSEVVAGTPEEYAAFIRAETIKWAKVVKTAGIQPE